MVHRMCTVPLDEQNFEKEKKYILTIARMKGCKKNSRTSDKTEGKAVEDKPGNNWTPQKGYIGQTKRLVATRIKEHIGSARIALMKGRRAGTEIKSSIVKHMVTNNYTSPWRTYGTRNTDTSHPTLLGWFIECG